MTTFCGGIMTTCVACPYGCACPHCCGCCCVATSYGVAGTNLVRVSHCGSVKRKALPLFVSLRAFVRRSRLARERAERARFRVAFVSLARCREDAPDTEAPAGRATARAESTPTRW